MFLSSERTKTHRNQGSKYLAGFRSSQIITEFCLANATIHLKNGHPISRLAKNSLLIFCDGKPVSITVLLYTHTPKKPFVHKPVGLSDRKRSPYCTTFSMRTLGSSELSCLTFDGDQELSRL